MAITSGPIAIHIETERFVLRTIRAEDASQRWCQWLEDPHTALMLNARRQVLTLEQLRAYIASFDQWTRLLIGLFDRATGRHFGIVTAEFTHDRKRVIPSMLIGEGEYRNIGALTEIRDRAGDYAFDELAIEAAVASVLEHNTIVRGFMEARGWKFIRRLPSEKKRADGQGYVDLMIYEFSRDTWNKQRAQRAAKVPISGEETS